MNSIEVAKIDPKTGLPMRDGKGQLVTHRVDPETGEPTSAPKKPSKKKTSTKAKKESKEGGS